MSPLPFIAALPIQRLTPSAGAKVESCTTFGLPPSGASISYHRTPAWLEPTLTVWLATRTSAVPTRRYCRRFISRSDRGSSVRLVPRCAIQPLEYAWPQNAYVYGVTAMLVGPERVEVPVVKSGVKRHVWNVLPVPLAEDVSTLPMYSASPVGGTWLALSAWAGSSPS